MHVPTWMRRSHFTLLLVLLTGGLGGGGYWWAAHNRVGTAKAKKIKLQDGLSIVQEKCLKCHGETKQEGGLRLDSMNAMMMGGDAGPALVVGEPEHSLMLQRIKQRDPEKQMPPKHALEKAEVAAVHHWIKDGAPAALTITTPAEHIGDAWSDPQNPIRTIFAGQRLDLWSLKPIANPEPPSVVKQPWMRNPIDAFVLNRIEQAGLEPPPEADRRTLIRRLSFGLTGLPPNPEAVSAFCADSSADAYDRLVTQLMDSPAYGEHWASMWLDVVRYSDSNGFDYDEFRPNAYRYRDYVIKAFNQDKPYDRFLREQLAGDELVAKHPENEADQDALCATGYLRVGPYDNSAVKFGEQDRCRAQVMNDLVETTGAAFLGLQLSCCRCHNHKVDPISQTDYYRLRAIFEPTQPNDELCLNLAPEQEIIASETAILKKLQASIDQINAPVAERVQAQKIRALATSDQEFLDSYRKNRTPEGKGRYKNLKSRIDATLPEILAAQDASERAAYEGVVTEMKDLKSRSHKVTQGFLITDVPHPPLTHLLHQGDFTKPRELVPPGTLSIFDPNPLTPAPTKRPQSTGRRSALVNWLTGPGNPLTTRVIVNRLWNAHFGAGIQATPNDFGYAGAVPTDPQLLDWLATKFRKLGGSIKAMNRLIVTSATYRQALSPDTAAHKSLWLGKMPRRLTAEALRDSMLQVSGLLLPHTGGPPLWPSLSPEVLGTNPGILIENDEKTRGWYPSPSAEVNSARTIYLVNKRGLHNPWLETFDQPDNNISCGCRQVSTVAPQALALLNSEFALAAATAFAQRVERTVDGSAKGKIECVFQLALQRDPDATELAACEKFLTTHPLLDLCRSVLNLNEFCYVD